jgi:hypothetical protein
MGMGHDSGIMAQMGTIHELFAQHEKIVRTVTNLPDGIRTITESDDPQVTKLIQEHVASMDQRVSAGDDPGLPIESPALRQIFRDKDKISTSIEMTPRGAVVVQTSSDPETVAALQQHAAEVSELVRGGMGAMHTAMMKNGGMASGMHGGSGMGQAADPVVHAGAADSAFAAVQTRGEEAMGVDQYTSTHRFDALADGGRIELQRDVADPAGVAEIRRHLQEIVQAFTAGDFTTPAFVHARPVPGTEVMAAKRGAIRYTYRELPRGGEVTIVTNDPEAVAAIHEFMAFQREDHHAGGLDHDGMGHGTMDHGAMHPR